MNPMEQVLTLPGEVERWAHYGTEYVKADDYAALNDYAALVQMERDMARAEVELLKVDLDETIKDSHKQLAEIERLRAALVVAEDALANCYDVCEWPAQNGSKQLDALRTVRAAFPTDASPASTTDA